MRNYDGVAHIQEGCNTLQGCSDVVSAAIEALHRQRSSNAKHRQQCTARVSFADAVKHLQSHYGPVDRKFLGDDPNLSSWDGTLTSHGCVLLGGIVATEKRAGL